MGASKEQTQAIRHGDGPMMVLAGPGSGKTYTITRRIQYLIEHHKVPPEQILVITFTKAAALEMQERFERLMGGGQNVTFGTFHAIYFHILRRSYHYDQSDIITEKEKREYLKEALEQELGEEESMDSFLPLLLNEIGKIKNEGLPVDKNQAVYLPEGSFEKIFKTYQRRMQAEHKVDFDDMAPLCLHLLQSQPELLSMWQNVYRYLLVDEFQDINRMQYEVVKLLALPQNNLFVVGDDDQSIYGFRGSDPSIMLGFPKDYPGCGRVLLQDNYRCTKDIVKSAVKLIGHNKNRFLKKLQAKKEGDQDVILTGCDSKEAEAEEIVSLIKYYRQYGEYRDIAVLMRTNLNASVLAQKLAQGKIPFWQKEKTKNLFEDPMAQDLLAMLHFAHGEKKRGYFLRFMNKPVRYLRRDMVAEQVDIDRMLEVPGLGKNRIMLLRRLQYDLLQIQEMEPYAAVNYIRKGIGYDGWVVKKAREKHRDYASDLELLDQIQNSAKGMESFPAWLEMIENYRQNLERMEAPSEKEDAVSLVTMHGSKGLEYKIVILPDVNEGNVPQKKAVTQKEMEEERRVFYVAMTRAKEKLFLFYVKKTQQNRLMPSRFLKEIGMRV